MQCTAKSKRSGVQCKNDAMRGKDKCRMHGGKTPIKHGIYSKYAPAMVANKINEARNDVRLTDIREDLALQRALVNNLLERYKDTNAPMGVNDMAPLMTLSDQIGKNIERLNKIENGETYTVKIETVQKTIQQVVEVLKFYVQDTNTREKIAKALLDIGGINAG